jgi:dienelactone hydrolase
MRRKKLSAGVAVAVVFAVIYGASSLGGCAHLHGHIVDPAPRTIMTSFCRSSRFIDGREVEIYTRGQGPAVLLLHEIPALTLECLRLAGDIACRGFTVHVPLLFGKPPAAGQTSMIRGFLGPCLFGRFSCFSRDGSGNVVHDMRTLSAQLHDEHPQQPLGVVGLCITGAIPLSLAVDPWVRAVVLGQPALPFTVRETGKAAATIAAAQCDIAKVKRRQVPVLALRFSQDRISPRPRLESLCRQLGPQLQVIEVVSGAGGIAKDAHPVLTGELDPRRGHPTQEALQRTLAFLADNLVAQPPLQSLPGGGCCDWTVLPAGPRYTCSPSSPPR